MFGNLNALSLTLAMADKLKCIYDNGGCEQYCTDEQSGKRACFCADDYALASDGVSCIPQGKILLARC